MRWEAINLLFRNLSVGFEERNLYEWICLSPWFLCLMPLIRIVWVLFEQPECEVVKVGEANFVST